MLTAEISPARGDAAIKHADVNGTRLAYLEKGAGEPLIFIHGALSDYRTWLEQIEFFCGRYRVVSYSRRHHYPNERGSEYSRGAHAADLIGFLEALGIGRAHLVGHSYGASVALVAALRRPELVAGLVLAEPSPLPDLPGEEAARLLAAQRAAFGRAAGLARDGRTAEAAREFLHTIVGIDVLDLLPVERRAVVLENAGTLGPMLETYDDATPFAAAGDLKNLRARTLLITGALSPKLARLNNEAIDRLLPDSRIEILAGSSHGLQMENPAAFNRMVFNFLSSCRG